METQAADALAEFRKMLPEPAPVADEGRGKLVRATAPAVPEEYAHLTPAEQWLAFLTQQVKQPEVAPKPNDAEVEKPGEDKEDGSSENSQASTLIMGVVEKADKHVQTVKGEEGDIPFTQRSPPSPADSVPDAPLLTRAEQQDFKSGNAEGGNGPEEEKPRKKRPAGQVKGRGRGKGKGKGRKGMKRPAARPKAPLEPEEPQTQEAKEPCGQEQMFQASRGHSGER